MAVKENRAEVVWQGDLMNGIGNLKVDSRAFPELPITFHARTEGEQGRTNPEELLAAAHAICYSMVMANMLAQKGTPPNLLTVSATSSLERVDGGLKISRIELSVRGEVPGMDARQFQEFAEEAEQKCPVSNALRGNVHISVRAELASLRTA